MTELFTITAKKLKFPDEFTKFIDDELPMLINLEPSTHTDDQNKMPKTKRPPNKKCYEVLAGIFGSKSPS